MPLLCDYYTITLCFLLRTTNIGRLSAHCPVLFKQYLKNRQQKNSDATPAPEFSLSLKPSLPI
ncbi:MAG: hypothetical protein J6R26_00445 [Paludibacteraceae bacterium]|nr:hypothetical protein [Paludibacteraceae bacterium]